MKQSARRADTYTLTEQPLTTTAVDRRLWCVEGFAWLHGPGLLGRRAQRSFDIWQSADERAVVPLLALRSVASGSELQRCVTYVFWTSDPSSQDVDRLVSRAESMEASAIRREALPYTELSPWRGRGRDFSSFTTVRDQVALTLSDPSQGRYAFTLLYREPRPLSALVVWARLKGVDYLYPVSGDLGC